jgi:peroxiredoxin
MKTDYPAYIRSYPASGANLRLISDLMNCKPVAGWMDTLDVLYRLLPASTMNSPEGKALGDRLTVELKTAIGHKAIDFTQYDTQGNPVSLSSLRGKYILLDFWASYDKNCDRALPVLNKVHEVYGSKGLVILAVSLDSSKTAWLDMIRETNSIMTTQVSDLKGKENAAAQLYSISDLPKNFLIDPNGIIIAKGLTSITLDQTLSAIFE